MSQITNDYFIPYMRVGLNQDGAETNGQRLTIPIRLNLSAKGSNRSITKSVVEKKIAVYGPSDVIGFHESAINQSIPNIGTNNFRADLIPYVEFTAPDFLWRYSSAKAQGNSNWIPWLSLILLKDNSESNIGEYEMMPAVKETGVSFIRLSPNVDLPDLRESWRWAHVHLNEAAGINKPEVLQDIIKQSPNKAISRLMAPRRLKTKTRYTAFIIPTFQLGVEAALGLDIADSKATAQTLTWETPNEGKGKIIPYYHKWSFQTGQRGDFEYLIRQIQFKKLESLGQRPVDCSQAGYGLSKPNTILQMEGPLQSPGMKAQAYGLDTGKLNANQKKLAVLLNKGNEKELKLKPPIYGRWYQSEGGEDFDLITNGAASNNWITELNLDYRHRIAASLGAAFVRENQEALMKSAWKQLAEIKKLNQRLNYARFGRAVSTCLYKRMSSISDQQMMRLGLSVRSKLVVSNGKNKTTVYKKLKESDAPPVLLEQKIKKFLVPKFDAKTKNISSSEESLNTTRIAFGKAKSNGSSGGKKGGVLGTKAQNELTQSGQLVKQQINPKESIEKRWAKQIEPFRNLEQSKIKGSKTTSRSVAAPKAKDVLAPILWFPEFHIPMYQYLREKSPWLLLPGLDQVPSNTISVLKTNPRFIEAFMLGLNHEMAAELRWRKFPTDMRGSYFTKFWDRTHYSLSEEEKHLFGESQIAEKLLNEVKTNAIKTLQAIEALFTKHVTKLTTADRQVMAAYEKAVEKWQMTRPDHRDIQPPSEWSKEARLGSATASDADQVVLLLRTDILQKAPSTLIYLTPMVNKNGEQVPNYNKRMVPKFEGKLPPDIALLGFPIRAEEAKKYFIVFEEPMAKTNYGFDEGSPSNTDNIAANVSWQHFQKLEGEGYLNGDVPISIKQKDWDNPAFIAKVCTQKSVRLAVPLSRFLEEKEL